MHERLEWRDAHDLRVLVADYRGLDADERADLLAALVAEVGAAPPDTNVISVVDPDAPVTRRMNDLGMAAARDVFRPRRTLVAVVGARPQVSLGVRSANVAAGGSAVLPFGSEHEALVHFRRMRGMTGQDAERLA